MLCSSIGARFAVRVMEWADRTKGAVTGASRIFVCFPWFPGDVRMPEVAYTSRNRLPVLRREGWAHVAPEFAVEVVSPENRAFDMEDKPRDYIRAGVDLVWVIVPSTESVHIWRKDGSRAVAQKGEILSGEDALPGFSVPVASLFEELD